MIVEADRNFRQRLREMLKQAFEVGPKSQLVKDVEEEFMKAWEPLLDLERRKMMDSYKRPLKRGRNHQCWKSCEDAQTKKSRRQ